MQRVVREETSMNRYLPTLIRIVLNLIVIAGFVVMIKKLLDFFL